MADATGNPISGEPMTTQQFLDAANARIDGAAGAAEEEPAQEPETQEAAETETGEAALDVSEPESAESEEPDTEQEPDGPQILTVDEYGDVLIDFNGEETSLKDLVSGNLRQSDYSRKMNEIAKEYKAQQAEYEKREAELVAREQRLADQLVELEGTEPDWVQLAEDDPLGWASEKAKWDARQKAKAERQAENERRQAEAQRKFISETVAKAVEAVPEWADAKVFDAGAEERKATALAANFTLEEYQSTPDFRIAALLHWASIGRKAMADKGAKVDLAAKKIAKAPKVLKPGQSAGDRNPQDERRAARQKRLRSGSISTEEFLKSVGAGR